MLIQRFFGTKSDLRFVRLTGFAGVGKSALARHTVHYVQERTVLGGGCVYVNARGINDFQMFVKRVVERMEQDASGFIDS
jgi:hypothetical protein